MHLNFHVHAVGKTAPLLLANIRKYSETDKPHVWKDLKEIPNWGPLKGSANIHIAMQHVILMFWFWWVFRKPV